LILDSNLRVILPHFRDIRAFVCAKATIRSPGSLFGPKFWNVPLVGVFGERTPQAN